MSASAHPPKTDPRKDSLIEYPSQFPIKVMGPKVDGFVNAITQIAREHDPGFDAGSTLTLQVTLPPGRARLATRPNLTGSSGTPTRGAKKRDT